jgi:hypothetical protein
MHFIVWTRDGRTRIRRWAAYCDLYLGHDVEPTCTERELGE